MSCTDCTEMHCVEKAVFFEFKSRTRTDGNVRDMRLQAQFVTRTAAFVNLRRYHKAGALQDRQHEGGSCRAASRVYDTRGAVSVCLCYAFTGIVTIQPYKHSLPIGAVVTVCTFIPTAVTVDHPVDFMRWA
ncbi:Hypothetical protein SMAX5B_008459 [Scophthalmus maximus]|uniref:Uncharacterized protein n=1 Tax=Scophthalmus maximus TaxID=52904 RepID=A0A2U9B3W6_SCOMX|nr:Hypothetical protein SMAX5B_008459 [Scophthalmus maximus]